MPTPAAPLVDVTPETMTECVVHAVSFVMWWHHAGRLIYGPPSRRRRRLDATRYDPGLAGLANSAARAVGGWRAVRRLLYAQESRTVPAPKPMRAIRLRGGDAFHATRDRP